MPFDPVHSAAEEGPSQPTREPQSERLWSLCPWPEALGASPVDPWSRPVQPNPYTQLATQGIFRSSYMPEGMQSDAGTELSWSASPTPGPSRPPRATASSVAEDQETLRQLELEHEAVNATDSGERSDEPYSSVGEEGDNWSTRKGHISRRERRAVILLAAELCGHLLVPNGKLRFVREVITQRRNACLENGEEPFEHKENTLKALFLREMNRRRQELDEDDTSGWEIRHGSYYTALDTLLEKWELVSNSKSKDAKREAVIKERRRIDLQNHKRNKLRAAPLEIEAEDAASECEPHTKKPRGSGRDQNDHVKLRRHGALNYALADRMIEHSREQQREFLGVFRELFGREQEAGGSAAPSVEVERRIGALEERLKEQKQEQDKKLEMIIGLLQQRVGSESSSKEGGGGKESSSGRESIV